MRALAIVLWLAGSAWAQGSGSAAARIDITPDVAAPEVTAAASPTSVMLGARFTLFVTAVYGSGVEVNLREPTELGAGFEVTRKLAEDKVRSDGRHAREWQLEVIAWELGDLQVPPVVVTFTVGGRAGQVESNPVPLHVDGVLGNVDDPKLLRGEAAPVSLDGRDWTWIWITLAAGCAILVIAIAIIVYVVRRRRVDALVAGASGSLPVRRIDTAGERALARLQAIDRSGVLARDADRKTGYLEMTEVIRDYLGARYRVATLDLTTSELCRALAKTAPVSELELVAAWLDRCDLVKYGGFRATGEDAASVLADARTLVVTTSAADAAKEAA